MRLRIPCGGLDRSYIASLLHETDLTSLMSATVINGPKISRRFDIAAAVKSTSANGSGCVKTRFQIVGFDLRLPLCRFLAAILAAWI